MGYWVEKISFWLGLLLLGAFALSRWHAHWGYQQAMAQFSSAQPVSAMSAVQPEQAMAPPSEPDDSPPHVNSLPDGGQSAAGRVNRPMPAPPREVNQAPSESAPVTAIEPVTVAHPTADSPVGEPGETAAPEPLYLDTPMATLASHSAPLRPEASRWSESRRAGYLRASANPEVPVALLAIPRIDLTVPVFGGVAERQLNKGVGWIDNGGALDGRGNLALAGHRDGFFRRLGDLQPGDALWVTDAEGLRHRFVVQRHLIVEPEDVWVLESSGEAELTLVTCYPFYFLGSAPQRYIVKATRSSGPEFQ